MPSRNGWAVLVASAAALLAGRLFGVVELFVVGAALAALVVLAVANTTLRRCAVDVDRIAEPARPEVGDDARVQLRLRASSSSPALDLWEPVAGVGGASLRVAPLRRGEATTATYRLPTTRRGLVRVGPLSADVRDPFGLTGRSLWLAPARDVLVYPTALSVALPRLGSGRGQLTAWLARRAIGHPSADEFKSLRDYVPGDDLRRVNWRVSARRDDLVVRESDPTARLHISVVFDLDGGSYTPDGFERAVSVAASMAVSAVQLDRPLRLLTTDAEEYAVDAVHLDEVLTRLALVEPTSSSIAPRSAKHPDGMHVLVVITGRGDTAHLARIRGLAGNVDGVVVITCDAGGRTPGGWFEVGATHLDDFARNWGGLVDGGGASARPPSVVGAR